MQIPGLLALHRMGSLTPLDSPLDVAPLESGHVPLVLLHGFPLDARMWQPVAGELAEIPIIAVDLPGFGASPAIGQVAGALERGTEPTLALSAEAVRVSLLALAGVRRAVIAGLSMGGYVTMQLAAREPGLFAGIGLLDTKADADAPEAAANRLRVAAEVDGAGALSADITTMSTSLLAPANRATALPETMAQWIAGAPPSAVAWTQRAMAGRPDSHAALSRLAVPAAVIVGEHDELATPAVMRATAASLQDAVVTEIEGAGHMTAVERPQETAAALGALYERAAG